MNRSSQSNTLRHRQRFHAFAEKQRRSTDRCLFCNRTARECVDHADPRDRLAPDLCDGARPYPAVNTVYEL